MILLLGGTTEAKTVAGWLEEAGKPYIYSTRTEVAFEGTGAYRFGSLDKGGLQQFCTTHAISCIINACHPFARQLHQTVADASLDIPLIRFERVFPERSLHPLVQYVEDYAEALAWIETKGYPSLLALTGVQSIPQLKSYWQGHPCWFRILNRPYSIEIATHHNFPMDQLLYGLPQEKEAEIQLLQKLQPAVILTKESGLNGKLDAKLEAAIACHTPILIIKKPSVPASYQLVHSRKELLNLLGHG